MTLTGPQRQAVERVGQDVCVVAGPGSGKTRVLVERFRWRLEQGFSPRRILAVTFTEKAATEIKQRLAEYFRSRPELREELERAHISTVHSFCAGLLREHAIEAGLDPQFEVLDESEALAELRAAAEETLDGLVAERPEAMRALLRAVDLWDPAEQLSRVYEARRLRLPNAQPTPPPVAAPSGYAAERALLEEALDRLDRRYAERKQALGALDFSDLEEQTVRLLRSDERLRERVQASFDEILMDELQDTNPLQAALINLVRRPGRFFAVGDINQSIYGFRHAEPEVFRRYRQELESQGRVIDRLEENHRSRADILAAVEFILGATPGLEPHELKAVGEFARKEEPSVEVIAALGARTEEAAAVEARWVARRIRELEASAAWQFSDMAVLVRNVGALPALEEAFRDFDVPHLIVKGKGFYETQEVTDLIHCLRILANPRDEVSLAAVLRSPLVGTSDETLLRLKERGNLGAALEGLEEERAIEPGDRERLVLFRDQLRALRAESDDLAPDRLLARAMDAGNYESGLGPGARANVRKLLSQLRDSFRRRPRPLARLVEELELRRASDPREPMAPREESTNAVRLMTIHSAKGLEFPVVFLAALHKGVLRAPPALAFSPGAGVAARWRDPASGEAVKDAVYTACLEELKRKQEAEDDRLFYVATTRAKEHLVLSFAAGKGRAREWAKLLVERLGLDLKRAQETPAVRTYQTGAKTLRVRLLCTASPPERPAPRQVEPARKPEERLRRASISGQQDSTVAVTSVWEYARCPRRYYLARYLGWEQPATQARMPVPPLAEPELDPAELGRQVHNLLAGLPVKEPAPEALELAARFQASDLARRAASAQRLEREFDFLMDLEDMLLEGRIDLWFEQGDELVLVDFKTDQVDEAAAASRAASYALQLQLYALALERHVGRLPDQALFYLLRPNAAVAVSLERRELEAARAAVRALRQAQSEMSFPPQAGEHCYRCGYFRGLCPAARAAATR